MTEKDVGGVGGEDINEVMESWETRAEELFMLCDREHKGIVTKRDLQRVWGELPLDPDELEQVFDTLDHDHNGYVTLHQFTHGFGCHLGLVAEFRAVSTSMAGSEVEYEVEGGVEDQDDAITTSQLDTLLKSLADHALDSKSAMVEAVWREVCGGAAQDDTKMEQFVVVLLQELCRVRADHAHLEAALATKTDQYNQQIAQLHEELESQLSGEQTRAAGTHTHKATLALLHQEVSEAIVRERESLVTQLGLLRTTNTQLRDEHDQGAHRNLSCRERKDGESGASSPTLRPGSLNSVTSSLNVTAIASPMMDLTQTTASLSLANHTSLDVTTQGSHRQLTTQPAYVFGSNTRLTYGNANSTDCEHDEEYFKNASVELRQKSVLSQLTTPMESDLQELLQLPPLCTVCGGMLPNDLVSGLVPSPDNYLLSNDLGDTPDIRELQSPIIERQESTTQTSPTELMSSFMATRALSKAAWQDSSAKVLEQDAAPTKKLAKQQICGQDLEDMQSHEVDENFFRTSTDNPARHCLCNRFGNQFPTVPQHSTTIVIYRLGHHGTTQVLPLYYTQYTRHTCHVYHTYLAFNPQYWDIQNKSTTQTESAPNLATVTTDDQGNQPDQCQSSQAEGNDAHGSARVDSKDQFVQTGVDDHRDQCMQVDIFCAPVNESTQEDEAEGDQNVSSPPKGICKMGPDGASQTLYEILDTSEVRKITPKNNFQNAPTIMVTPLPRHYSYGDNKSKMNDESAELKNNDGKKGDRPLASSTSFGGKPLLYCPSRMFKVVFIGDSGVGKTSFIHRVSMGEFRGDFGATVGVDYHTLEVQVGGVLAVLQLWDTAGQERFRSITRQYYRKVDGVVVMYDLTSEQSFLNVVDWITSVKEMAGEVVTIMLGNKEDLQESRCISQEMADKLAKANCCFTCECSAATGSGVEDVMTHIATLLTTKQVAEMPSTTAVALQEPFNKGICCK